jgi:hypothetical protein
MAFDTATWRPVSFHEVYAAFLRGEPHRFVGEQEREAFDEVTTEPLDYTDPFANHVRMRLLFSKRGPILLEIPPDTEWSEVSFLVDGDLNRLRCIPVPSWTVGKGTDRNDLRLVAAHKSTAGTLEPLRTTPETWSNPIVWGHSKQDLLTILEGNNRFAHLALGGVKADVRLSVFVGLSPTPCFWHVSDRFAGVLTGAIGQ